MDLFLCDAYYRAIAPASLREGSRAEEGSVSLASMVGPARR